MSGPRITTGSGSKQDYGTPADFLNAVVRRFGPLVFDLATTAQNACCPGFFASGIDSLAQDWTTLPRGNLWLNPPFAHIAPWVEKCAAESARGCRILLLVPAAVGANWFRDHAAPCAQTYLLNGRLCFDGKNLYPKDCMLAAFGFGPPGMAIWNWRTDTIHAVWKLAIPGLAPSSEVATSG